MTNDKAAKDGKLGRYVHQSHLEAATSDTGGGAYVVEVPYSWGYAVRNPGYNTTLAVGAYYVCDSRPTSITVPEAATVVPLPKLEYLNWSLTNGNAAITVAPEIYSNDNGTLYYLMKGVIEVIGNTPTTTVYSSMMSGDYFSASGTAYFLIVP